MLKKGERREEREETARAQIDLWEHSVQVCVCVNLAKITFWALLVLAALCELRHDLTQTEYGQHWYSSSNNAEFIQQN